MGDLTIKDLRITLLTVPYVEQPAFQAGYNKPRDILVCEIETAAGHVGLGYQLYLREGMRTTRSAIKEMHERQVIGRDATEVEGIWRDLYKSSLADGRGGAPVLALSAIDVALWDIVGQAAGLPLHRLWGHVQPKIKAYGSGVWRGMTREGMIEKALRFKSEGFSAIKMQIGHNWGDREDVENVRQVRSAIGDDIDIMVDANMAYTADHAILMGKKIQEYGVYWLEEPVVPDDFEGYFRIANALDTRVVGGESHFTRFDLKPFFQNPVCPILQPDVIRGGLTELRKIATIADTFGLKIAPHLYPELMIHLMASIPNPEIIEDMGLLSDIWVDWAKPVNGIITAPEAPGHGLKIKPEIMQDFQVE
jgi:L-alanine-DL-glutamate epimerase-like enolase superfamily enzyme